MQPSLAPIRTRALPKPTLEPRARGSLVPAFLALGISFFVLLLAACGGGGGSGGGQMQPQSGELTMVMRDAEGDFLQYAVDVTSIKLMRANGDVVETLPLTTRVDLTQLVDLSEIFTHATVPSGDYTSIVVSLDYTNAQITVQDQNGVSHPATAVDTNGAALGKIDVQIDLPSDGLIRIGPATPSLVTLDFDLDASNDIDFTTDPAIVTVEPMLSVTPSLDTDREHRVRGLLSAVDTSTGIVTLDVRPFDRHDGEFGKIEFATDADTKYEINGTELFGDAGFTAFAALAADTPVVASGMIVNGKLSADVVLAGSSVPWASAQVVDGVVMSRAGDVLRVSGITGDFATGEFDFHRNITVIVSDATVVTAPALALEGLDIGAISVGSRLHAVGTFASATTLDASAGRVRLEMNQLVGTVVAPSPLVVDVLRMNGRPVRAFDFSGTGTDIAHDANPQAYEVATGALDLSNLAVDDLVRVRGQVGPFGSAPPDFIARTLIRVDLESNAAALFVSWRAVGGATAPFSSTSPERIDVDLSDARYALDVRGVPMAVVGQLDSIALLAPGAPGGYLVVARGTHEIHLYRDFDKLVQALNDQLAGGKRLNQLIAGGRYNATTHELTMPRASFEFSAP